MWMKVAVTRFFVAEDGTEIEHALTFSGQHTRLSKIVGDIGDSPVPNDFPPFCGTWRVMTEEEAQEYEARRDTGMED